LCQFSQEVAVCSRPAKQGEALVTHHFGMGLIGLASPDDPSVAACVPVDCELRFEEPMPWACGALVFKGGHTLARGGGDQSTRAGALGFGLPHDNTT